MRALAFGVLALTLAGDPCDWEGAGGPNDYRPPAEPADAPWDLDAIALPDDLVSAGDVFRSFPGGISGHQRVEETGCFACPAFPCPDNFIFDDGVCYAEDGWVAQIVGGSVATWSTRSRPLRVPRRLLKREVHTVADSFDRYFRRLAPGAIVNDLSVTSNSRFPRSVVDGIDLDPSDDLLWIQLTATYPELGRTEFFVFGEPDSAWIFAIESDVGGLTIADLAKGFVCAVRGTAPCVKHAVDAA